MEEFLKSGKGLVVVHGASYPFTGLELLGDGHKEMGIKQPAWPEYLKMIGGYWSEDAPKTGHGQYHSFSVKLVDPQHPIARGIKGTFWATDELYHNMRMQPGARVLATAYDDPKYGGTGKDEPVLWTVAYGNGRVFHITLGHDLAAMQEPGFRESFLRGTEWAATDSVTRPPKLDHPEAQTLPLRLLVVTGGHEYPTSFYTLFDGVDDSRWSHAVTNHEAFSNGLRGKYDVLVLYDLSNEISESERTNLKDYLESGKGIMVLHHAIADYTSWDWWSREVVGGKYLFKPEGGLPASTFKHDEQLFIQPAINHPITARVGALHLVDETYKGMWISPEVKVLLKTSNPTSDGPVAWISPYPKTPVVYIQLGHGEEAHRHPGYRALVQDTIRWVAGRIGGPTQ